MSVAPETLDTIMCEWCSSKTVAIARVDSLTPEYINITTYLCSKHANEAASEMISINLYPLVKTPEYSTLESEASPMTGEWSITQLEQAARYGAPYPVCGDLTTLRSPKGKLRFDSWTGHDPSGEQY